MMKIKRNSIRCKKCNTELISTKPNIVQWCECKSVGIEGGLKQMQRFGNDYKDTSIVEKST